MSMLTDPAMPRGRVSSSGEVTGTTGSITTSDVIYAPIADQSFTAVTGRVYRVTLKAQLLSTVDDDTAVVTIFDGGSSVPSTASTVLYAVRTPKMTTSTAQGFVFVWELTGATAGLHRLAVGARRSAGTGTLTIGDPTRGSLLLIEDVGV